MLNLEFMALKDALKTFENTQRIFSDVGANDTEPCYIFHHSIYNVLKTGKFIPLDEDGWELYTEYNTIEAVQELNKVMHQVAIMINICFKKDHESCKHYLSNYCWRIDWPILSLEKLQELERAGHIISNGIEKDFSLIVYADNVPNNLKQAISKYHSAKENLLQAMKNTGGFEK